MSRAFRTLLGRLSFLRERQAEAALFVFALVFLGIAFLVRQPGVLRRDEAVTDWIQAHRTVPLDAVAFAFTFLGNTLTLIAAAVVAAILFLRKERPKTAFLCGAALLGVVLNVLLKEVVERPRPGTDQVAVLGPTVGTSFPSGHAMGSAVLYGFFAVLAWIYVRGRKRRTIATVVLALTAMLIGLSRVYRGAHWLSDVIGGWAAGLFCMLLLVEAHKRWAKDELRPSPETSPPADEVPTGGGTTAPPHSAA